MSKFLVLEEYGLCIKANKVDGIQLRAKINEKTNRPEYYIQIFSRCVERGFSLVCENVNAANELIEYIADVCNIANNVLHFTELKAPSPAPVKEEQKITELPKNTEPAANKVDDVPTKNKNKTTKILACNDSKKTGVNPKFIKAFAAFRNAHTQYIMLGYKGGTYKLFYNHENGLADFENDIKMFEDAGIDRLSWREYLKCYPND